MATNFHPVVTQSLQAPDRTELQAGPLVTRDS